MNDEVKLGLVAGVLAVVGVAVFGVPKDAPRSDANRPAVALPMVSSVDKPLTVAHGAGEVGPR
jgi:hypothetical protein